MAADGVGRKAIDVIQKRPLPSPAFALPDIRWDRNRCASELRSQPKAFVGVFARRAAGGVRSFCALAGGYDLRAAGYQLPAYLFSGSAHC